jgi:hypothetical protein
MQTELTIGKKDYKVAIDQIYYVSIYLYEAEKMTVSGEGSSGSDYDRRRVPDLEKFPDGIIDPHIEERLSELEEAAEDLTDLDPNTRDRHKLTRIITEDIAEKWQLARRRYQSIGGMQYTIEEGPMSGGRLEPGEFQVLLLTENGLTPPIENPDSTEHMIVRFRSEDIKNGHVMDCWIEHHRPETSTDQARIDRWRIGRYLIERWNQDAPNEPFGDPPSYGEIRLLYYLGGRLTNYQLAPQRNGIMSPTITADDPLDAGLFDDESPEYQTWRNAEIVPTNVWGEFYKVFAGRIKEALKSLPENARDFSNRPFYKVRQQDGFVRMRIFLTDEETAQRIEDSRSADSSPGLLVEIPIQGFRGYIEDYEKALENNTLGSLSPARARLEQEAALVIQQHLAFEYRDKQGCVTKRWEVYPSRVELTVPRDSGEPWRDTIKRDAMGTSNPGKPMPYMEMLHHITTLFLSKNTVLSKYVPNNPRPHRYRPPKR